MYSPASTDRQKTQESTRGETKGSDLTSASSSSSSFSSSSLSSPSKNKPPLHPASPPRRPTINVGVCQPILEDNGESKEEKKAGFDLSLSIGRYDQMAKRRKDRPFTEVIYELVQKLPADFCNASVFLPICLPVKGMESWLGPLPNESVHLKPELIVESWSAKLDAVLLGIAKSKVKYLLVVLLDELMEFTLRNAQKNPAEPVESKLLAQEIMEPADKFFKEIQKLCDKYFKPEPSKSKKYDVWRWADVEKLEGYQRWLAKIMEKYETDNSYASAVNLSVNNWIGKRDFKPATLTPVAYNGYHLVSCECALLAHLAECESPHFDYRLESGRELVAMSKTLEVFGFSNKGAKNLKPLSFNIRSITSRSTPVSPSMPDYLLSTNCDQTSSVRKNRFMQQRGGSVASAYPSYPSLPECYPVSPTTTNNNGQVYSLSDTNLFWRQQGSAASTSSQEGMGMLPPATTANARRSYSAPAAHGKLTCRVKREDGRMQVVDKNQLNDDISKCVVELWKQGCPPDWLGKVIVAGCLAIQDSTDSAVDAVTPAAVVESGSLISQTSRCLDDWESKSINCQSTSSNSTLNAQSNGITSSGTGYYITETSSGSNSNAVSENNGINGNTGVKIVVVTPPPDINSSSISTLDLESSGTTSNGGGYHITSTSSGSNSNAVSDNKGSGISVDAGVNVVVMPPRDIINSSSSLWVSSGGSSTSTSATTGTNQSDSTQSADTVGKNDGIPVMVLNGV